MLDWASPHRTRSCSHWQHNVKYGAAAAPIKTPTGITYENVMQMRTNRRKLLCDHLFNLSTLNVQIPTQIISRVFDTDHFCSAFSFHRFVQTNGKKICRQLSFLVFLHLHIINSILLSTHTIPVCFTATVQLVFSDSGNQLFNSIQFEKHFVSMPSMELTYLHLRHFLFNYDKLNEYMHVAARRMQNIHFIAHIHRNGISE